MIKKRIVLLIALAVNVFMLTPYAGAQAISYEKAVNFVTTTLDAAVTGKIENKKLSLKEFPGFKEITSKLPGDFKTFLESFVINVNYLNFSKEKFWFSGSVEFKGTVIVIEVRVEKAVPETKVSFKLALPKGWKFSETFSQLKNYDKLAINNLFLLISTYDYEYDEQYKDEKGEQRTRRIKVEKGATFNADIELTSAVQKLRDLIDELIEQTSPKAGKDPLGCLIIEDFKMQFSGVIKPGADFNTSHFFINLPYKIGIDLTKIKIKGKLLSDPYVRRFYTSGFLADVDLALNTKLRTGFFLELKNEKEPAKPQLLEFIGELKLDPKGGISITAWMDGMYEYAFGLKWLSIGPRLGLGAGIMAEPPWLKEIAVTGGLSLGEVLKKASATIDFDFTNGSLLVDFSVEKLDIDELIKLMITIGEKIKPKNKQELEKYKEKLPDIEFNDLKMQVVPVAMTVFDKSYSAGISAGGKFNIAKVKGGIDVHVSMDPSQIYAQGVLDPLEVKNKKGKIIFKLDGPGPDRKYGTADDGAILEIDIKAGVPIEQQKIYISGILDIPPLKFKQKSDVLLEESKFHAILETTIEEYFTGKLEFGFDPKNPEDFMVDMSMDQKFAELLAKKIKEEIAKFTENANKNLKKARKDVEDVDEKMNILRAKREAEFKKTDTKIAQKIKAKEDEIDQLDKELEELNKACPGFVNLTKESCRKKAAAQDKKNGLKIEIGFLIAGEKIVEGIGKAIKKIDDALEVEKAAQEIARAGLKVAEESVRAIAITTNALAKAMETFEVKSARFATSGSELKEGKLPLFSINIRIAKQTIEINELQLDLKNPLKFFGDVAFIVLSTFAKKTEGVEITKIQVEPLPEL